MTKLTKRALLFCSALVASVVLLGGGVCLVGNPVSGDTWGHEFANGYLYLDSHQQEWSFRVDHVRGETGLSFGRCHYIWNTR